MPRIYGKKRKRVKERAKHCCEYCRILQAYSIAPLEVEHIDPLGKGGGDDLKNLALSCTSCNQGKGINTTARDPMTEREVPLFHPRKDVWSDHFRWSSDYLLIVGTTPTGRATVDQLRMNNDVVVRIRGLIVGWDHPPE